MFFKCKCALAAGMPAGDHVVVGWGAGDAGTARHNVGGGIIAMCYSQHMECHAAASKLLLGSGSHDADQLQHICQLQSQTRCGGLQTAHLHCLCIRYLRTVTKQEVSPSISAACRCYAKHGVRRQCPGNNGTDKGAHHAVWRGICINGNV